jgi:hypothetical protein
VKGLEACRVRVGWRAETGVGLGSAWRHAVVKRHLSVVGAVGAGCR